MNAAKVAPERWALTYVVDVLEPVAAEVNPAVPARDNDNHVLQALNLVKMGQQSLRPAV